MDYMTDKIYLFIDSEKKKYATAQITQFDAETCFAFSYGDDTDYSVKEVELDTILKDNKIEWF